MDMDFTFPATSMTTPEPPAAVVAGPLPASACRPLPFPRFAAASSSSSSPPWSPTAATGAPPVARSRSLSHTVTAMAAAAQQGPPPAGAGGGGDAAAVAVAEVEDRMDLLWEDFNEELARGRGGSSCRAAGAAGLQARELWSESESSDAELAKPAAALGCAPVLRPSSRAAGAVRHCRRRAGTWVLLMRIFRRLFVVEKTVSSAAAAARRRHHAAATARAS